MFSIRITGSVSSEIYEIDGSAPKRANFLHGVVSWSEEATSLTITNEKRKKA